MDNCAVDIEKIMSEMRSDISLRYLREELASFTEMDPADVLEKGADSNVFSHRYFFKEFHGARNGANLSYYREIDGNFVFRIVKRAMRKLNTFLVKPIVDQQSEVNSCVNQQTYQLYLYIREQEKEIKRLKSDLAALEGKLD